MMDRLFGKSLSPDELAKKWQSDLRSQSRDLDRSIRNIEREEAKVQLSIKQAAKQKNMAAAKSLAKELIRSRKAKDRMHTSKAQLNSVGMQLKQQVAQMKVAGALQKSSEIMKMTNALVKLPELTLTMGNMQREMMKAGLIEEMMADTMDMMDGDDIEEEAEAEIDAVIFEITKGILGTAGPTANNPLESPETQEEEERDQIAERLQALKN